MEYKKLTTRKNHRDSLLRALIFIEKNLDKPLAVSDCASIAHISPFHFHRIFSSTMEETVNDYIKRRRVEKASLQLLTTDKSVTEIGLSSGYGTLASFAKVFKKYTDKSPSGYRKEMRNVNLGSLILRRMKKINDHGSTETEAQIKLLPDRKALFIRKKGFFSGNFNQAIKDGLAKLFQYADEKGTSRYIQSPIVMCQRFPKAMDDPDAEVYPGLLLKKKVEPHGDIAFRTIGGGAYALFQYTEPSQVYQFNWETYRDWARIRGYDLQSRFPYTVLKNSKYSNARQYKEILHVPVESVLATMN